jgi:EAL domain-containing protein (putative c-di-GMP-specific phosphodiesterase class I)
MTTIAEGVERQEQFGWLQDHGCDQSQGFLHSRPVPVAEFVPWLAKGGFP